MKEDALFLFQVLVSVLVAISSVVFLYRTLFNSRDENTTEDISGALKKIGAHNKLKNRKIYVLVNPFNKGRKGEDVFRQNAEPLLKKSGLKFDVVCTERPQHAMSLGRELNLNEYDACLILTGDGTFVELLEGLSRQYATPKDFLSMLRSFPMFIVPYGTNNMISHTMQEHTGNTESESVVESTQRAVLAIQAEGTESMLKNSLASLFETKKGRGLLNLICKRMFRRVSTFGMGLRRRQSLQ